MKAYGTKKSRIISASFHFRIFCSASWERFCHEHLWVATRERFTKFWPWVRPLGSDTGHSIWILRKQILCRGHRTKHNWPQSFLKTAESRWIQCREEIRRHEKTTRSLLGRRDSGAWSQPQESTNQLVFPEVLFWDPRALGFAGSLGLNFPSWLATQSRIVLAGCCQLLGETWNQPCFERLAQSGKAGFTLGYSRFHRFQKLESS